MMRQHHRSMTKLLMQKTKPRKNIYNLNYGGVFANFPHQKFDEDWVVLLALLQQKMQGRNKKVLVSLAVDSC